MLLGAGARLQSDAAEASVVDAALKAVAKAPRRAVAGRPQASISDTMSISSYPCVPEGETPTWSPRKRVTRGTNRLAEAKYAQAAYRYPQISFGGTSDGLMYTGFRVCLVLPDEPSASGK